ncbi:hypothetical protein [Paenibacillus thermotolerans]|uniref:hypothetical protein n=1 Tax=Paenibacillus thermotolerans TaxID=3027807 RepID=UPI002367EDCA|nr:MULTISPECIES: hypothetical protein [unclassified Paenibacillus]
MTAISGRRNFGTFSSRFAQVVDVPPNRFRSCVEECIAQLRVYHARRLALAAEGPKLPEGAQGTVSIDAGFEWYHARPYFLSRFRSDVVRRRGVPDPAGPRRFVLCLCAEFFWDVTEEELSFRH